MENAQTQAGSGGIEDAGRGPQLGIMIIHTIRGVTNELHIVNCTVQIHDASTTGTGLRDKNHT